MRPYELKQLIGNTQQNMSQTHVQSNVQNIPDPSYALVATDNWRERANAKPKRVTHTTVAALKPLYCIR